MAKKGTKSDTKLRAAAPQQTLDLGPQPEDGKFNVSYQTQIFSVFDNGAGAHLSKGFKSTDLIPFFIHDRRQVSFAGPVTAAEAISTRLVEIDGKSATLTQRAANITSKTGKHKGQEIFRHLGEREETILDALKYIASHNEKSFGDYRGSASLKFSLAQIKQVIGGSYNNSEILEALDVLHGSDTEIKIQFENGETKPIKSSLLPILITHDDPDRAWFDEDAKCMCTFHPSITLEVANLNFRQINYSRIRSRHSGLAKHLERRLSHRYTQASEHQPYGPILASSILRSAGLAYDRTRSTDANFKPLIRALKELTVPEGVSIDELSEDEKNSYIIAKVDIEPIYEETLVRRKRIIDYKYVMYPTQHFIQQQIDANIAASKDAARLELARELKVSPAEVPYLKLTEF